MSQFKPPVHDLLGEPLTDLEHELCAIHSRLEEITRRDDLVPCVDRGARAALAVTWQILNDLNLDPPAPERLG